MYKYLTRISISSILILIVTFSIGIRMMGLWSNKSLYNDEVEVWDTAKTNVMSLLKGDYGSFKHHPPLYYLFIHYWLKIDDSESWMRIPSVSFSLISIIFLYILVKRILDYKTAVITTILFSTSVYHIIWSLQVRIYPLLLLISLIYIFSFYFSFIIIKSRAYQLFNLFIGILAINIDYSFIWIFIALNLYYLFQKNKINIKFWTINNFILILIFIYYFTRIFSLQPSVITWIKKPEVSGILTIITEFVRGERMYFYFKDNILIWITEVASLLFIFLLSKQTFKQNYKNRLLIILVAYFPLLTSFIFSQIYPVFISRNIMIASLGIFILIALAIQTSKQRNLFIILWIIINMMSYIQFIIKPPIEDWKTASNFIKKQPNNTKYYFFPFWFSRSYNYYIGKYKLTKNYSKIPINKDISNTVKKDKNYCFIVRKSDLREGRIEYSVISILSTLRNINENISGINIYCY